MTFFFRSSLDFGRKMDVMTFKEAVLLLRSENISDPVGMVLNCAPPTPPEQSYGGQSLKLSTKAAVCKKESLTVNWRGQACRLVVVVVVVVSFISAPSK